MTPISNSRTVRVFLSSTFRDFAGERNLLVKTIFPELRRRCRERQVELVDVDLRWGITEEEAQQGKVLPICLAEIDRSRPFFMGFLGERYGWVPEAGQYDRSLLLEQPWLEEHRGGKSVTELEILHGVLDNPAMEKRAFFYFRDPAWSEAQGGAYLCEGTDEKAKLEELKERIRRSGFPVVENYASPEELAERVREDLWQLIDEAYPESEVPDALTRERMTHEAYGASRRRLYLGGEPYFAALDAAMAAETFRPVLVRGQSGGGKSALLANWVGGWSERHPGTSIIVHHLGGGADAADPVRMVVRLMREISRLTGDEFKPESDPEKQLEELPQWLGLASAWAQRSGRELLLVLDGLDKVSAFANLRWFPGFLPQGVKLVASCLDGEILTAAQARLEWFELVVEPFSPPEQITFIKNYLGRYRKALTEGQSRTLLAHPLSGNPLFLLTVLEELRVFGVHEQLESRLHALLSPPPGKAPDEAPTVDDVFEHVLARIEEDLGRAGVQSAMESIWASRGGLYQDEVLAIAGIAPATWAGMANALDEALYESGGRIQFAHDYLRQAVEDRYGLTALSRFRAVHRTLGNFFTKRAKKETGEWDRTEQRPMLENVYHYIKANCFTEIEKILTDFSYLIEKLRSDCFASGKLRFGCVKDLQLDDLALDSLGSDCRSLIDYRKTIGNPLDVWVDFIQTNFHLLRRGSFRWPSYKILLQIAIEHGPTSTVTQAAESWLKQGMCDWLWLRCEEPPQTTRDAGGVKILETPVMGVAQPSSAILFSWDLRDLKLWNLETLTATVIDQAPVTAFMTLDGGAVVSILKDGVAWRDPETGLVTRRHTYSGEPIDGGMLLKSGDLLTWSDHDKESQIWSTSGLVGSWKELWTPRTWTAAEYGPTFRGYLSVDADRLIFWGDATFKIRVWNIKNATIACEWDPIHPEFRENTEDPQEGIIGTFSVHLLEYGDLLTEEHFDENVSVKRWSGKDYQLISEHRVRNETFSIVPLNGNRIAVLNHCLGASDDSYIFDFDHPESRVSLDVSGSLGGRLLKSGSFACWTVEEANEANEANVYFFNSCGDAIGSRRHVHGHVQPEMELDDGFNVVDSLSGDYLTYSSVDQSIKIWTGYGTKEEPASEARKDPRDLSPKVYDEWDYAGSHLHDSRKKSIFCVLEGGFQLIWTPFLDRPFEDNGPSGVAYVTAPEEESFNLFQIDGLNDFEVSSLQLLWNGFQLNCSTNFCDGRNFRELSFRVFESPPQYPDQKRPASPDEICKVRLESSANNVEVFPNWKSAQEHASANELGIPFPSARWEADTAYKLRWIDGDGCVVIESFMGARRRLTMYFGCDRLNCDEVVNLHDTLARKEDERFRSFFPSLWMLKPSLSMLKDRIRDVLDTLNPREREVLELRFGLVDGYSRTLEEVAKQFRVTRERIRQIEAKALRKMRHPTRIRQLEEFVDAAEQSEPPREGKPHPPSDSAALPSEEISLAELIRRHLSKDEES